MEAAEVLVCSCTQGRSACSGSLYSVSSVNGVEAHCYVACNKLGIS